jgi:UDP-N-acetylglucosamine--N-acetylmuramyl-(pentapeptide) pyrophosphoryl-undecaprenol N-acetylglucosamine transferase
LGPVTPLLAVAEAWRSEDPRVEFVWVGTPHGPEREVIDRAGIEFFSLPAARLPRYPSREWLFLPWQLVRAVWSAWRLLDRLRPSVIASAGGYTAVPVIVVGHFLGIPSWVHQQDAEALLSNRLAAPFASLVTVVFERSRAHFCHAVCVGNPVRASLFGVSRPDALRRFGFDPARPTVLILGGGGGSVWLNETARACEEWLSAHVNLIHVTGRGKHGGVREVRGPHRVVAEFLVEGMADAFAAADVVLCRAGMGTMSELVAFSKAAVVVPLPKSPQEANARELARCGAAVVLEQAESSPLVVRDTLQKLLKDHEARAALERRMHGLFQTAVASDLVHRLQRLLAKT